MADDTKTNPGADGSKGGDETKATTPPVTPTAPALPASVTLASLYSFWEDDANGKPNLRTWFEGQVETNPAAIKLLIERGAPLKK